MLEAICNVRLNRETKKPFRISKWQYGKLLTDAFHDFVLLMFIMSGESRFYVKYLLEIFNCAN